MSGLTTSSWIVPSTFGVPRCCLAIRRNISRLWLLTLTWKLWQRPQLGCMVLILIMSLPERANQSKTVDTVKLKVGKLPTD